MSSSVRSRSVSRSRVIKQTDLFPSGQALDPYVLLEDILNGLVSTEIPLSVIISDGDSSVSFLLSFFLSKEYEVDGDEVIFGFRRLKTASLRAKIEFNISLDNQ
jgi:hypothetical protein